jgi:hypothetical protein
MSRKQENIKIFFTKRSLADEEEEKSRQVPRTRKDLQHRESHHRVAKTLQETVENSEPFVYPRLFSSTHLIFSHLFSHLFFSLISSLLISSSSLSSLISSHLSSLLLSHLSSHLISPLFFSTHLTLLSSLLLFFSHVSSLVTHLARTHRRA